MATTGNGLHSFFCVDFLVHISIFLETHLNVGTLDWKFLANRYQHLLTPSYPNPSRTFDPIDHSILDVELRQDTDEEGHPILNGLFDIDPNGNLTVIALANGSPVSFNFSQLQRSPKRGWTCYPPKPLCGWFLRNKIQPQSPPCNMARTFWNPGLPNACRRSPVINDNKSVNTSEVEFHFPHLMVKSFQLFLEPHRSRMHTYHLHIRHDLRCTHTKSYADRAAFPLAEVPCALVAWFEGREMHMVTKALTWRKRNCANGRSKPLENSKHAEGQHEKWLSFDHWFWL